MHIPVPEVLPKAVVAAAAKVPSKNSSRTRSRLVELVQAIQAYETQRQAEEEELLVLLLAA